MNATDNQPSTSSSHNAKCKPRDIFQVNTGIIPQASLEEQENELEELGLSVFNQDVFEQGIMEQVDEAVSREEETRLRNILQKELKTICDDIKMAKNDLEKVNRAEANFEEEIDSRESRRHLDSIKRSKENKIKQLKTLKVRRGNILKKLNGFDQDINNASEGDDSTFNQAFQLKKKPTKESERERMIRTGEMTPFGTVIKTKTPAKKGVSLSGYEKALGARESTAMKAKKDFSKYLKKKSFQTKNSHSKENEKTNEKPANENEIIPKRKRNFFDEKDCRIYDKELDYMRSRTKRNNNHKMEHSFSEDIPLSDDDREEEEHSVNDDEDLYEPSLKELKEESSDSWNDDNLSSADELGKLGLSTKKRKKLKKNGLKKPRPLPKYKEHSDEEDHLRTKVKRDRSIKMELDDADPENYNDRLLRQQKIDKKEDVENKHKCDEDDDDDGEFDGGFRVPPKLWKKLFNYQRTGVRWLWELHCQQAGGIVGDEMGLGKTIQTISFLGSLRSSKVRDVNFPYKGLGPTIIVCPTTVMHQWLKEFHKWWPEFRVVILHSSGSFTGSVYDLVKSVAKSQGVLITSYNTLVIHQETVLRFNWHYVILDEGHKIRNPDAKATLCCKQFRTPHRIILSGSPIQNNLKELWSLFDFVFPGKLGTLPDFMQHFSIPIVQGGYSNATQIQVETAYRCACVLRDTINPYLIRRMKADVKKAVDLPNKNEQVLFCRLTDEQRDVYMEYLGSRECNAIMQGKFQVFSGLITLRKICNHPDLSTGGPSVFSGNVKPGEPEYQYGFWKRSGKMIVVEALLRLWHKQNQRVLLFTQSKSMLNILEKFVQEHGYSYLVMDGATPISGRQPLISQYNNDQSIFVFLLTTRVGGLGVNLTGANRVIIFDPDWNPSTDIQARERAWRIGQKRQVTIYRLLTSGSIEEKIYHRQIFKQFLTNRVLKDPKQRRLFKSQDMMELFTLGSKDNEEGTETSALFAGTGSDVKVPKRVSRNRFDEIHEKKKKEEKDNKKSREQNRKEKINDKREDEEIGVSDDELERMKEIARQLSKKMEIDKKRKQSENSEFVQVLKEENRTSEDLRIQPECFIKNKNPTALDSDFIFPICNIKQEKRNEIETNGILAENRIKKEVIEESTEFVVPIEELSELSTEFVVPKEELSEVSTELLVPKEELSEVSTEFVVPKEEFSEVSTELVVPKEELSEVSSDIFISNNISQIENTKQLEGCVNYSDNINDKNEEILSKRGNQSELPCKFSEIKKWNKNGKHWSIPKKQKTSLEVNNSDIYIDTDHSELSEHHKCLNSGMENERSKNGLSISQRKRKTKENEDDEEHSELSGRYRFNSSCKKGKRSNFKELLHEKKKNMHGNDDIEEGIRRKKNKKKHRNARFEGERIPNLVKHCPLTTKNDEKIGDNSSNKLTSADDKDHDDVVLRELFKKTGIQGAMKHDKIMDSGRPDYAIVEAEAEKVAKEAAAALRRSRQQCASALSGVPTWTGNHGAVAKPRFGQKKNSLLVGKTDKVESHNKVQSDPQLSEKKKKKVDKDKLFDGSVSGNSSLGARNGSLTSDDLLSKMQSRKRISTATIEDDDDFLRPDPPQNLELKDSELMEDIRSYVAFMAARDGEASTQEIVLNFGKRLPKTDAPKFKAMLNQICDFHSGFWRLKPDFR